MKRDKVVKTINAITSHDQVLKIYNSQSTLPRGYKLQLSDPWCAATVSAVFIQNGYYDISECSCDEMLKKAKRLGIWVEADNYKPNIGDVLLYDWQDSGSGDNTGYPDHVGIVINTYDNYFIVREGNKANAVGNRTVKYNDKYIRGFITPKYEKAAKTYKTVDDIVNAIISGDFGNGENRKQLLYNYFQNLVNKKLGGK